MRSASRPARARLARGARALSLAGSLQDFGVAEVFQLIGQGRSVRDIAETLFLSPKTVEYHLRHVYTKLGIASRQELSTALQTTA